MTLSGIHLIAHSPRGSSTEGSALVRRFPALSEASENITRSPDRAQPGIDEERNPGFDLRKIAIYRETVHFERM